MAGYLVELESLQRLKRMLDAYESGELTPGRIPPPVDVPSPQPGMVVAAVTGAVSGGTYPGILKYYDGAAWQSYGSVLRMIEINGNTLLNGNRYYCRYISRITISTVEYGLFGVCSAGTVVTGITCVSGVLTVTSRVL